jgi:NCS1 family nucleobase:cation symporter-1
LLCGRRSAARHSEAADFSFIRLTLLAVLIADYYLVKKQRIVVDDLFTMSKAGTYWYKGGYNPKAIAVTAISAAVAVFPVLFGELPGMTTAAQYSWFIGCGPAFALYWAAMRNSPAPAAGIGEHEPVGAV